MARGGYQDRGALVRWVSLYEPFGHGYQRIRGFRRVFVRILKFVKIVYHEARVVPYGAMRQASVCCSIAVGS